MTACGGSADGPVLEKKVRPVRFSQIASSSSALEQSFAGTAQSSKEAALSFKVSGTVNKLAVKVGDRVNAGQTIALLDATDYNVSLEQSRASLKSAETQIKSAQSQLNSSRSTYQRVERLYENNSVSLSEFEQAKAALETAESSFEAAKAQTTASQKQMESARNQVTYATLKAPFSGVITMVNVEENELVGSGTPVAALNALTQPEVQVGIPEAFISRVKKGQSVSIHFSVIPDQNFEGTVNEVGFSAVASTYPVTITINKPTADIRPGMAASVNFKFVQSNKQLKDPLIAPVAAVGEGIDGHFVFLLAKNGEAYTAKKQLITIGELMSTGFEIKSGLKEGDLVATAGLNALLDGMSVKLLNQ